MGIKLSEQQSKETLKALDDAIEKGPWDQSNFLRVIGKNLQEIRENFAEQVEASSASKQAAAHLAHKMALRSGQQEVYIRLYSSNGIKIPSWERIIANLPKQMISRPVYESEKAVQAVIKTKANVQNEGYLAIYVNKNDILSLSEEKTPVDKLGKPLLSLKDKSIHLDNINYFVHVGNVYKYRNGSLIRDKEKDNNQS